MAGTKSLPPSNNAGGNQRPTTVQPPTLKK